MKNLRKTVCVMMALLLIFVVGGCGQGSNVPGTQTGNTGNAAINTGSAIVPGTSAITGTNNVLNTGTNPGRNLGFNSVTNITTVDRRNLGVNNGTNLRNYAGTNLAANTGTNLAANTGTNWANTGTNWIGTNLAANTGTNNKTNSGFNLGYGANNMTNWTNKGTNLATKIGNDLGMNVGTNNRTTNRNNITANISKGPGTGFVPKVFGTAGNQGYKDGSFTASGNSANGSQNATVTINNGKIETVVLRSFDKARNEVNYNADTGAVKGVKTSLKSVKDDISQQVISKQNANIVTVKGITTSLKSGTAGSWITAVKKAIDKARA